MFCVDLSQSHSHVIDVDTESGKSCRKLFHKSLPSIRRRVRQYGIVYHAPNHLFFDTPEHLKKKIVVDPTYVMYTINNVTVDNVRALYQYIKIRCLNHPKSLAEWLVTVSYCDTNRSHTVIYGDWTFTIQAVLPHSLRNRYLTISGPDRGYRYTVFLEDGIVREQLTRRDLVWLLQNKYHGRFDKVSTVFNTLYAKRCWSDDTIMITLDTTD